MNIFSGVSTALVTPFKDGQIDFASLKKLMTWQLDRGIQGFVVAGSTGEAATLSVAERTKLLEFVIKEAAGAVPVIMGSGTFNTAESCDLVKTFSKLKPSGFLIVTPYYNKPPQRGMIAHYKEVAHATELPIIVYNVPGRTSIKIEPQTVLQLSKEASNIVAIKEAAGDLSVIESLLKLLPKNFTILSGDDPTFLESIGLGGNGVISVVSHVIPQLCVESAKQMASSPKDPLATAAKLSEKIRDISNIIFCESNPIPVKWALKEMGIIASNEVRLPLVELAPMYYEPLTKSLKNIGAL